MTDRRDHDLDTWLSQRIEPLPPPPGTFELIKRRARRRKLAKLGLTAGVAAVIVAAAVTVPQVVNLPVLSPGPTSSPAAGHSPSTTVVPSSSAETSSATPLQGTATPEVLANFRPTSVTFIGQHTGWVIGQAGPPGHCATTYCTSMARTSDSGHSWTGVPAPATGAPDGATGVGQVRFLNRLDGWAFGPELYATSDGGNTWTSIATHGQRVTDLETVGNRAFAVFASCTGGGAAFAADCTRFTLYSSPAGTVDWTQVGTATTGLTGSYGSASLALTGSRGYLLAPDGTLFAGPVDGSASWSQVSLVPCAASAPPEGALLATVNATNLALSCTVTTVQGQSQKKLIYSSTNEGSSWQQIVGGPAPGIAASLAASPAGTIVLGTNQGIDLLPAGGSSWQQATVADAPAGGFGYVGMTTDEQGVALPADPTSGQVWFTYDGGQTWQPSRVG